jgi:hypothetical protein
MMISLTKQYASGAIDKPELELTKRKWIDGNPVATKKRTAPASGGAKAKAPKAPKAKAKGKAKAKPKAKSRDDGCEEEEEEDKLWRRRDNFRALETPPPLLPTHKSIRSR